MSGSMTKGLIILSTIFILTGCSGYGDGFLDGYDDGRNSPGCNRLLTIPEDSPDSRYQYRLGYEDGATDAGMECILGIPQRDEETLRDRYRPGLFGWLGDW